MSPARLTVAVTGPTGTFGSGLIPLLQDDDRIERVIGIARRPFDPSARGWTKMEYRQGDVDTTRARRQLGWQPRYTGLEALRDTLRDHQTGG